MWEQRKTNHQYCSKMAYWVRRSHRLSAATPRLSSVSSTSKFSRKSTRRMRFRDKRALRRQTKFSRTRKTSSFAHLRKSYIWTDQDLLEWVKLPLHRRAKWTSILMSPSTKVSSSSTQSKSAWKVVHLRKLVRLQITNSDSYLKVRSSRRNQSLYWMSKGIALVKSWWSSLQDNSTLTPVQRLRWIEMVQKPSSNLLAPPKIA